MGAFTQFLLALQKVGLCGVDFDSQPVVNINFPVMPEMDKRRKSKLVMLKEWGSVTSLKGEIRILYIHSPGAIQKHHPVTLGIAPRYFFLR